jgi:hypothetical protein
MEVDGPANGTTYGRHGVDAALLRALLSVWFLMSGVFLVNRRSVLRGWRIANWVVASWKSFRGWPELALFVRVPPASIAPSETYRRSWLTLVDLAPKA